MIAQIQRPRDCRSIDKYAQRRSPSHDDVVDWNVDKLDEETDETHYQEADGCGLGHLHKLCMVKKQYRERGVLR